MRCFIAVDIDKTIKEKIMSVQKDLPTKGLKIVEPDNIHFTMKFIGECTDEDINYIEESLSQELSKHTQISIKIKDIGVFPKPEYVKVIWISSHDLADLMKSIRKALPRFKDDHDAIPHLTIARVKNPKSKQAVKEFVEKHKKDDFGKMTVKSVKLKKSTLTPQGPVYKDLKVFELKS